MVISVEKGSDNKMKAKDIEQYKALKAKATLSTEEEAVVAAYEASEKAEDALEEAQEALVATPSTTV